MSEPTAPTPDEVESELDGIDEPTGEVDDNILGALSKLKAPDVSDDFSKVVEDKIRTRSAGRFFGRPTLADRVWIGLLALLILVLGPGMYWLMQASETGSLKLHEGREVPELAPGAREAVPRP